MRVLTVLLATVAMSCSSPSPNSSPLAFCAELAARACDQQISCSKIAASHRSECVETIRVNLCGVRANESNRALFKLNEKLTTKCLADLKSKGCTREGTVLGNACYAAIEPAVAVNARCETDQHCRDINQRCIGLGCERTCQTVGLEGQPCIPGATAGTGSCLGGLLCDATAQCSKGGTTGAECLGATLPCNADNFCDTVSDKCVALPTTGQPCRFGFPQCAEASYCAALNCADRLQAGAVCVSSNQCVIGTSCRAGTCQAQAAEGAACVVSSDCATSLSCDNVSLTCQRLKRAFFEEACSSSSVCYGGLACRNLKPARSGAAGTAGVCGISVAGDSCFSSTGCAPGTFCNLPVPPTGEPGTCNGSATGTTCSADDDCVEGEACHIIDRKCATRASVGANCAQVACVANASCIRQLCTELPDLNGVCSNDMVKLIPCRSPLICARTSCISAGRRGEACLGSATAGTCFAGACIEGVCGDQRPDGATCRLDTDCRSATCERGICVQQCN